MFAPFFRPLWVAGSLVVLIAATGGAGVAAQHGTPAASPAASPAAGATDDFNADPVNQGAKLFAPLLGDWVVQTDDTAPSAPNVYAQVATGNLKPPASGAGTLFGQAYLDYIDKIEAYQVFPATVFTQGQYADLDLSVAYKPISGKIDQTGGLIFRIESPTDYYIWRCNALEQDCRLWLYKDGQRTSLYQAKLPQAAGEWHRLRVVAQGSHIQGYFDDRLLMDFDDTNYASGRVGLWTKADAVTEFDDFSVKPLG
jgi:hypothetical protein